ncbi:Gfo/Idh/MocA family protein [Paracidobacterium acidisoli]|uniref:Gfo/Idh/MocA family oxidoreductase n=1 Tax=Paracidobacterium acidisoli TaxID=2303751 RepID=A0A372IJ64_9BACT|nr:Gfo/Idh/MocA family oxidoreductase [Paracidobacterium acidisoli]MBT9333191.1 Gfo/Idh/MocA family oxidoreductase [Paracidobacterium acidisoli]
MDRRQFLSGSAAASGLLLLKPKTAFGYEANSAVRLALLGCGNRGTTVATSFAKNTSARIVALADIFPDKLELGKTHFDALAGTLGYAGVDRKLMFRGWRAFEELAAAQDVDAVQISTPPFFHVQHLDAIVRGGKHAYCEKPVGVDIAQTKQALEIAQRVERSGKVSVDVGFQIRSAPPYVEIVRRIHEGALGKIACIAAHYNAPPSAYPERTGMSADEVRLRDWLWDRVLSGDILVEQDIHVIDICNWVLGAHPLSAVARCGRNVLSHAGDISDNYQVVYTYAGDVRVSFSSTQFDADNWFDVSVRVFGAKGVAEAPYSGPLRIIGENAWTWSGQAEGGSDQSAQAKAPGAFAANGAFTDNLADADRDKDRGFIESIVSGRFHNQIAAGVESARSAMLGRMAAAQKHEVAWDELLVHGEEYRLNMDLSRFT